MNYSLDDVFYPSGDRYLKLLEDFKSTRNSWLRSIRNLPRGGCEPSPVIKVIYIDYFIKYNTEVEAIEEYIKEDNLERVLAPIDEQVE